MDSNSREIAFAVLESALCFECRSDHNTATAFLGLLVCLTLVLFVQWRVSNV